MDESQQVVVVVVEEADASRTALQWAVRNFIRGGDSITLLHVCPANRSKKKRRTLRRRGFHLALSFKDLCNGIAEAKVEIIVTEGDQVAAISSMVNKVRASALVVGLHDRSFLHKTYMSNSGASSLNCRILAVRHHSSAHDGFGTAEFSRIEVARIRTSKPKIQSLFCLLCFGLISTRPRRRR